MCRGSECSFKFSTSIFKVLLMMDRQIFFAILCTLKPFMTGLWWDGCLCGWPKCICRPLGRNHRTWPCGIYCCLLFLWFKFLTTPCTGFCQLWNCPLPQQTPMLTGISHFYYHLTCLVIVLCLAYSFVCKELFWQSLTLQHFNSLVEACTAASAASIDEFSSIMLVFEQNSWKLVHLDSKV